jgi:phosphate transport system protein
MGGESVDHARMNTTLENRLHAMATTVRSALRGSADTLVSNETFQRRTIVVGDAEVDRAQSEIHSEVRQLLESGALSSEEIRIALAALTIALHLERIGDAAVNVATLGSDAARVPIPPDTMVIDRLHQMGLAAGAMLERAMDALSARDSGAVAGLSDTDDVVDDLDREIFRAVVGLGGDRRWREWGLRMEQISRQFAQAADHAVDIARQVAYLDAEAGRAPAEAETSTGTSAAGPGRASR